MALFNRMHLSFLVLDGLSIFSSFIFSFPAFSSCPRPVSKRCGASLARKMKVSQRGVEGQTPKSRDRFANSPFLMENLSNGAIDWSSLAKTQNVGAHQSGRKSGLLESRWACRPFRARETLMGLFLRKTTTGSHKKSAKNREESFPTVFTP